MRSATPARTIGARWARGGCAANSSSVPVTDPASTCGTVNRRLPPRCGPSRPIPPGCATAPWRCESRGRSGVVGEGQEIALRERARPPLDRTVLRPHRADDVADAVLAQEEHQLTVAEDGARAQLQQDVARLQADLVGEAARLDVRHLGAWARIQEQRAQPC